MAGHNPYPGSDTSIYNQPGNNYNTGQAPVAGGKQSESQVPYDPSASHRNGTVVYDGAGNPHYANVDRYGNVLLIDGKPPATYAQPASHGQIAIPYGGGGGGITQYEQQQIALDKRRLADAEAQQKAAQQLAESQAVEGFNKDYRDFQAKSYYGSQYGPTYFSPAGSVFAQRAPESATLKQAFKDAGQADPWQQQGNVPAGYTGVTYSNAQHPGLVDWGQPSVQQNMPQSPTQTSPQQQPTQDQFQQWHDLAHQLPQPSGPPQPISTQPTQATSAQPSNPAMLPGVPVFDQGGTVPGPSGSPQLIQAMGGEQVVPPQSPDNMGGGDWQSAFNAWHDSVHQGDQSGPRGMPSQLGSAQPMGVDSSSPIGTQNAYGQTVNSGMMHGLGEDINAAPMGFSPESKKYINNHVQYGPELTGLSGYGSLITPNGTPVVMSEWQKQQFDPTSIANYGDYAHAIAGWNPADLAQYGTRMTGNVGDLSRPTNFAPIGIQPSPGGG